MHELFADWYKQVDLSFNVETLNKRWSCIEAAVKKLDENAVMQLTRVCFALPKPGGAGGDPDGAAIAHTFKEADVSFPMKGNEQLLRVLFGATLAQAIEERHALATFAALAVTSAHCAGLVELPSVEELPAIAERYLAKRASEVRSGALKDLVIFPEFGKSVAPQMGAVDLQETTGQPHWAQVQQNFQNLGAWVTQVNAAIVALGAANLRTQTATTVAFKANAGRAALEGQISVLKEECNVLWWLFGEYSTTVKKTWSDGTAGEFCIALGRELAAIMAFYEPSSNTESFLSKALSRSAHAADALTVNHVLDAGPPEWRATVAQDVRDSVRRSGGVTPLHTGLVARVDTGGGWVERLTELTVLKPEYNLTPGKWALQACREALVLEWLEQLSG